MAPEAQRLEDAIRAARYMDPVRRAAALRTVDAHLADEPYEASDWDVLSRLRFAAGPAEPVAAASVPGEVLPAADEAQRDVRWLAVGALTIVANTVLVPGSIAPRPAALARRPAGRQERRRAG